MTTAVEALARQTGKFLDPTISERGAELVDLSDFLLDVVRDNGADIDLAESITSGSIDRTMDGASTLTVTVHDSRRVLMKSGIFGDGTESHFPAIDVLLDGLWFRLVQISKSGLDITLTFEDRIVSYLRLHKTPRKSSRMHTTRAEFVRMLVREVKATAIDFYSPELHKKQPIAQAKKDSTRRANRDPGLLKGIGLNVKGNHATKTQIDNAEKILDAGHALGANRKCMVASLMVAIQESDLSTQATNTIHVGLFQQDTTPGSTWVKNGGASRDATKDATAFFTVCIAADLQNPGMTLSQLCEKVQVSGQGSLYGNWTTESKNFVDQYDGTGGGSGVGPTYVKAYEYHRGQPDGPKNENTWDCAKRLADEVRWRRFVVGTRFYFIQDSDLMSQKPFAEIGEDDEGIDWIDFDMDQGKPVAEATVHCRADRWFAPPGCLIQIKDQGPANGRWLVWTIHREIFSTNAEITLRQPETAKKEPAPEVVTQSTGADTSGIVSGGRLNAKGMRDAIVKAAELALSFGPAKYNYGQVRPYPRSLFGKGIITTDCSGFVTLCYKAAGAGDPNGTNYDGNGYTGTLWASGTPVHAGQLQPGDLVFYNPGAGPGGSPGHVAIYVDNGETIGMGGNPDPTKNPLNMMPIAGYRTYDLQGQPFDFTGKGVAYYNKGAGMPG